MNKDSSGNTNRIPLPIIHPSCPCSVANPKLRNTGCFKLIENVDDLVISGILLSRV